MRSLEKVYDEKTEEDMNMILPMTTWRKWVPEN
jgi:hypothetical protein